jgi:hypothetical protein
VVNLIQSNSAQSNSPQFNSVENSNASDGQTAAHSSSGGFPGLLSLASGERASASDGAPANGGSFREHLSGEQSSGNRLSGDHSSPDRPFGDRPSGDRASEGRPSEDRPSEDRSSGDSAVAGSLSLHFGSAGREQKRGSNSEKEPSDPTALAMLMNPLLAVYPPVAVPQAVPQAIPVFVPTSGSMPGSISAQLPDLASASPEVASRAEFQHKLSSANGNDLAAADALAKQNNADSNFLLNPNSEPKAASLISDDEDGSPTAAADIPSTISSEARSYQKKSADIYTTQAAPQVTPSLPDQNPRADSVSSNSNLAALPATDAAAVYPASNSPAANSLPPDFQTTGDAAVAATADVPSAATQIVSGVATEFPPPAAEATGNIAPPSAVRTMQPSGPVPQAQPRSPVAATTAARHNASPAHVIVSAKSGATSSSTNHSFKSVVPTMTSTAQGKPDNKVSPSADGISSSHSSSPVHHGATPGDATTNGANSVTAKPGNENTDSGGKDSNNKDMANKDLAGNEPIKDPGKDFINKDLNSKALINKDLTNKDLLSKDIHTQIANSNSPNGQLPGNAPPTVLAASANPVTIPSIDTLSASVAIAPQPAASSSPGASASSANPSSTPAPQDPTAQQSAASGSVQLARIADNVGQSEMHIGMRMPAFGSVEVHTSVHQSEVGITVGSEHGDLKTFLNAEIPALRDSLNQQNLQFSHLNFKGAGDSAGSSFGGDARGNSQGFIYKPNLTRAGFHSEVAAIADSGGLEGEIRPASQTGLSIHA